MQNRVAIAQPRLPADVRNIGVTVTKSSPDLMMVVHLYSPDKSRDTLFISNYATLEIKDALTRIDGVGSITVFGSRDYSMRIWLDPDRLQSLGLTASDVTQRAAGPERPGRLRRAQPAAGRPSRAPSRSRCRRSAGSPIRTSSATSSSSRPRNAVVRLKDVARVELAGARLFVELLSRPRSGGRARGLPAAGLERAADREQHRRHDGRSSPSASRPASSTRSSTTRPQFIQQSVDAVEETIFEAILLVVLVIILFLQTWRAAIIPIVAIPVSLVGTFFFMAVFGFTLNNLSLFGLVLAIGIVVDDAIVVVENVERNIAAGLTPHDAAVKSMDEVGAALIAIALVLCAVFVPSAFITGISGQFYRQFALTIAGATVISLIVSLTLSPAMCALLLKPHDTQHRDRWWERPIRGFFRLFNRSFDAVGRGYGWLAARMVRSPALMLVVYVGILAFGLNEFRKTPIGFIPQLDRGYLIVVIAAAARRLAGAHRRGAAARGRHRAQDAGRRARGQHRRLLRRDLHQRAECRRDLPRARSVRGARPAIRSSPPPASRRALFKKLAPIQEALILVVQPPPVQASAMPAASA